jgi:hypothetical protein
MSSKIQTLVGEASTEISKKKKIKPTNLDKFYQHLKKMFVNCIRYICISKIIMIILFCKFFVKMALNVGKQFFVPKSKVQRRRWNFFVVADFVNDSITILRFFQDLVNFLISK